MMARVVTALGGSHDHGHPCSHESWNTCGHVKYFPGDTALKERIKERKKCAEGLDNGGNIEGICIFCG
jgi:hypothetical protein